MSIEATLAPPLSILFAPGDSPRKIEKAFASDAEAVCLDLEDAVSPEAKKAARTAVASFLQETPHARARAIVRINEDAMEDDLFALEPVVRDLFALMLPKASAARIASIPGKRVIAVIEDPEALRRAHEIAAMEMVIGLGLGVYDFAAMLGADTHHEAMNFARYQLRAAASEHGKWAFDAPYADFKDAEGLVRRAEWGRACGYDGMLAIHPNQLTAIHEVYYPTKTEITAALEIVEAFKDAGGGVVNVKGRMIDRPIYVRAKKTLALAARG